MHKIIEQFNNEVRKYEAFMIKVEVLINELVIQKEISFHTIESRIKDSNKLEEKLARKNDKYNDLSEITDVIGIRVITYFEDDVDKVASLIEEEFSIDKENSVDKRNLESDRFGYRSLHYVAGINANRKKLMEYSRFKDLKFEVQIRSVLQHAWAEIEHDMGYKSENSIPNEVKRSFYRVAALLETADIEFVKIKEQLKLYESRVESEIMENPAEVEINSVSLYSFIHSSPTVSDIDRAIVSDDKTLRDRGRSRIEILVDKLYFLNVKTIKQLDTLLMEKKDLIIRFASRSLNQTGSSFLSKGISIFYLCYVLVGEKKSIEFASEFVKRFMDKASTSGRENIAERILTTYNEIEAQNDNEIKTEDDDT